MSTFLCKVTEEHRADTASEAAKLIEDAKTDGTFTLLRYSSTYKETKKKGEVEDAYYKVTFVKQFTDMKDPVEQIEAKYEKVSAF